MNNEFASSVFLNVGIIIALLAAYFLIRKANQHLKLLGIKNEYLRDKTFFDIQFNLILFFEAIHVMLPYFIREQPADSEEEIFLGKKILRSVILFWSCIGFIVLLLIALGIAFET